MTPQPNLAAMRMIKPMRGWSLVDKRGNLQGDCFWDKATADDCASGTQYTVVATVLSVLTPPRPAKSRRKKGES